MKENVLESQIGKPLSAPLGTEDLLVPVVSKRFIIISWRE